MRSRSGSGPARRSSMASSGSSPSASTRSWCTAPPETRLVAEPQRCWEDVVAGDALDGFSLPLTMTRMVQQVSGTQDFYPVHHDSAFARDGGHADIFINTGFIRAALCRLATDWRAAQGFLGGPRSKFGAPHR